VLRNLRCDIASLQETKMEEVNLSMVWGRLSVHWVVLSSVGRFGGIVFSSDDQVLELIDSKMGRMLFAQIQILGR